MAGSRSSCGSARHLGHMVALRRKRQQSSASITASRRCSRATPVTISRCGHVTALISGPRALTGSLPAVPAEPRSSRASGDSAVPQPLRRGIRPNLISPKSNGVGHIASDESPAPPAYAAMWSPGGSENPLGTADLVYLGVDWVDCNADD